MTGYEGYIKNVRVCGIASAVPKRVVDNEEFASLMGGKRNKRQIMLTGIKTRHICGECQSASDFATIAADRLLNHLQWNREEIKIVVFVTQQNDMSRPSTAMLIQKRLGLGKECTCFDVNMGCSGFTVGLQIVASLMQPVGGKALLLVGDGRYVGDDSSLSRTDLLFGDGGAAAALESVKDYELIFNQKSDGYRFDTIMCRRSGEGQMDGNGVLLFSLNEVADNIKIFRNKYNINEDQIDYYVFHQAQKIILQGISHECGISWNKVLNSFEKYGNTSSASIPISICHNIEEFRMKNQIKVLMSGFGIGLSWGIVYLPLDVDNILPVIETDYCYPDKEQYRL